MDPIIDVLIETTQGSKHKYEYDHERRAMRLDRRLYSAVTFPADYGFVAGTEGADGEPLDAPVLLEDPNFEKWRTWSSSLSICCVSWRTSSTSTRCWSREPPRHRTATRAARPPCMRSRPPGTGPGDLRLSERRRHPSLPP